jgi:hypothetical protein
VLNAIAWIAKVDVPKTGVPSKEVTMKDLLQNQDFLKPENWKNQKNVEQKMARFRLN